MEGIPWVSTDNKRRFEYAVARAEENERATTISTPGIVEIAGHTLQYRNLVLTYAIKLTSPPSPPHPIQEG